MRFMIIVKSTPDFEADTLPQTPDEKLIAAMADFHEELSKAGVLLDASGLQPSRKGWRIHYDGQKRTVVDGPFAESKELIAGFTTIDVRSRESGRSGPASCHRSSSAVRTGRLHAECAGRPVP
jgi:hypothetical protein